MRTFVNVCQYWLIINHIKFGEQRMRTNYKLLYSQTRNALNLSRKRHTMTSLMTSFDKVRQYYLIKKYIKFFEDWMQTYEVLVLSSSKYTKF